MDIIKNGFKNERLGIELDVYKIEGKEWFRAKDISDFLGYIQASDMLRNLDFTDVNTTKHTMLSEKGNYSDVRFMNEFAIYECVLKIRKVDMDRYDKAREFQNWVFSEVLPSIRKNSYYVDDKNISSKQLIDLEKEISKLKVEKGILHEMVHDIADASTMSFTEVSNKIFGKNAKYLKKVLVEHKFIAEDGIKILKKEAEFRTPKGGVEKFRIFTSTNVEKCREKEDIRYNKITNFGYMFLKKYFNAKGLSGFKFEK